MAKQGNSSKLLCLAFWLVTESGVIEFSKNKHERLR